MLTLVTHDPQEPMAMTLHHPDRGDAGGADAAAEADRRDLPETDADNSKLRSQKLNEPRPADISLFWLLAFQF